MTARTAIPWTGLRIITPVFLALWGVLAAAPAQAQDCNAPAADIVSTVSLPGAPFSAIPTKDGCTIFVSIPGHIAVLSRSAGKVTLAHNIPVPSQGGVSGMALSHDGKSLAVSNGSGVLLFDAGRLAGGDGTPLAEAKDQSGPHGLAGSVYAAISPDDKLLFVSDEDVAAVTVFDLSKLRGGDTQAIGRIPVGFAPVGLVFSPDGRRLYTTSEIALPGSGAPAVCPSEGVGGPTPQGVLTVVDVARAASDPTGSVLAKLPGGCDPVRIVLSADGARAFVTARGADSLLVFDTARMVSDSGHALIASVIAGKSPVGVAIAGGNIVTADSNRFAPPGRPNEWLTVIDPGTFKVTGNIAAGLFPRELFVTADGKTLLVTNFSSSNLQLIDLARLTPAYFAQVRPLKDADDAGQARAKAALDARIAANQPSPGTEASLRRYVESMEKGQPNYEEMSPALADAVRRQLPQTTQIFAKLGALTAITFERVSPQGADMYAVTFQNGKAEWTMGPLDPNGKVTARGFRVLP